MKKGEVCASSQVSRESPQQLLPCIQAESRLSACNSLNRSKFSLASSSVLKNHMARSYLQRVQQDVPSYTQEQYRVKTTAQINLEFNSLKQELRYLSEQLNRFIESKNIKNLKGSSINETNSNVFTATAKSHVKSFIFPTKQAHDHEVAFRNVQNNEIIKYQKTIELSKLKMRQQSIVSNPVNKKKQLKDQIQALKEEIKSTKKDVKVSSNASEQIGKAIVCTDALIEEIALLQEEQKCIQLRKRKLQKETSYVSQRLANIQQCNYEIEEKQSDMKNFQMTEWANKTAQENSKKLAQTYSKRKRLLAALKRGFKAQSLINSKKYYKLLEELNTKTEQAAQQTQKYEILKSHISETHKIKANLQELYKQLASKKRVIPKCIGTGISKVQKSDSGSAFLTEKENQSSLKNYEIASKVDEESVKELLKEVKTNIKRTTKNLKSVSKHSLRAQDSFSVIEMSIDSEHQENNSSVVESIKSVRRKISMAEEVVPDEVHEEDCEAKSVASSSEIEDICIL